MSLAIMFEDDTVVFLDAVKNYGRTKSARLTKHRIDKSGDIADHYAQDNKSFSVRGIVSSADFNVPEARGQLWIDEFSQNALTGTAIEAAEASITSSALFGTGQIESAVSNLLGVSVNGVQMDAFRGQVHELVRDKLNSAINNAQSVTLLDMDNTNGGYLRREADLMITRFSDDLDDQSGDALYFDLTLEQARWALITEVDVEVSVPASAAGVQDAVDKNSKKGAVTGGSESTTRTNTFNEAGGYKDQLESVFSELLNFKE